MELFKRQNLSGLYVPPSNSTGGDNGQVTIIGGSSLFHGAPILSLKAASKIVDMVFFTSPEKSVGEVASKIKSKLLSFIWVPFDEVHEYIKKSDAVLIGPGMMRYKKETQNSNLKTQSLDEAGQKTREITRQLLLSHPDKKWVIDAGSLQTMETKWIPKGAILTPNKKEFERLFNVKAQMLEVKTITQISKLVKDTAKTHNCVIVLKGPTTIVSDGTKTVLVEGGNAGLTKGGTGDVQAGVTVALLAKNDPILAASAASYIVKNTADKLYKTKKTFYNSDDVAESILL